MRKFYFLLLFIFFSIVSQGSSLLFKDGITNYDIVLCKYPSESEKTAAKEMASCLRQISNVSFKVVNQPLKNRKYIYVGYDAYVGSILNAAKPNVNDDGFKWVTKNENLYIYGGKSRGTMYGIYKFLEEKLGVRWYTQDFTLIKQKRKFLLMDLNEKIEPAFKYRTVLYYTCQHDAAWDAHNELNSQGSDANNANYGGMQDYAGIHTMGVMVSPKEFFSSHPEYFAMRDGKRISDGQLCLSNPNVIKILKERILESIKEFPGYWCFSVSQNDNELYCECKKCKALEKKYGGHSGLLIWAVNQIADEVSLKYPNVYLGTLAYQYTQAAPKNIRPRKNVVIRLCDVQCCLGHSFESNDNITFLKDLNDWSKLTTNIYVWDYATSFFHYMMPFPNFHAVADNLRLLKKLNSIGVMEEGQYDSLGGSFYELKQWLFSKLLWNPNLNVDTLAYSFIKDYYGKAAEDIFRYYKLCNDLNKDHHLMFTTQANSDYFSDKFITSALELLNSAYGKSHNDNTLLNRVNAVRSQILYLKAIRNPIESQRDGTTIQLIKFLEHSKWNYQEGQSYLVLIKKLEYG